ncbi:MAG: enoyl-CoA hydratase/isomerase family protein [Candidatus Abyssobacteria bacterium SURF_5]|uniref:Enoyl-CoA hydratase/isomerase family protein n=1 Tax=Abyssobacteria bacterium (strain SURF_5) TaxID=2093360 RepID=A0A3A4NRU5_ABYX5|nr:MAG: enoyl-CoA hydratase/isomerase family protein [Candidatus Abyssubacteria bacterium SURF_5]
MAKFEYEMDEHVAILTMNSGENRFNFSFFNDFLEILATIERDTDARVLVVKSAHEKIWSNGIDLDWLRPAVEQDGPQALDKFLVEFYGFLRHLPTYPMITVAAISGHAFAGGAVLSFIHDFRFMRADRGWMCLNEVDIGIALGPVITAVSKRALPLYKFEEMAYTGKRITAQEAQEHHIIMKACPLPELMKEALAFAKPLKKDRDMIRQLKLETHKELLSVIDETVSSLVPKTDTT